MHARTMRTRLTFVVTGLGIVLFSTSDRTVAFADNPQSQMQPATPPRTLARAGKARPAADAPDPVWVRTGGPIGGIGYDIRSRPDNPDSMFVTDVTSGLNISVDGGRTWAPSNAGLDVNFVFSATVDPTNNNIAWVGTQARMGIFKSIDGGRTWERKSNGVAGDVGVSFRGFTVDPTNSNIVYAAGEISSVAWNNGVTVTLNGADVAKGMVYKTTDGGTQWTQIWSGDNVARYVWIDPRNTNVLYVSTGIFDRAAANANVATQDFGGVGILKSADGGQTWRVLNKANGLGNLFVSSLFMHPTNPDILVAGTGGGDLIGSGVYLTTNGGETWTKTLEEPPQDPGSPTRLGFGVVEISPVSPNVVFAATNNSFYRSDDGGWTWNRYTYPGSEATGNPFWGPPGMKSGFPIDLEADRRDPMRVFANMYQGGNLLSTDGGRTWANASRGYTGAMVKGVEIDKDDPAIAYSVASNGVFKSRDSGGDWQGLNTVSANFPAEMETVAVSPSNGRHVLVSDAMSGRMYKSLDGGQSWDRVLDYGSIIAAATGNPPSNNDALQGFTSIVYAPSDTQIVYAGIGGRYCFKAAPPSRSCDYPTFQGVHRSTDGGTTWEVPVGDGLGLRSIRALAVHPTNPDVVYAATGAPGLFKTDNGGRTWVPITNGISSLYLRSIAIDPSSPETVYAGTGSAAIFKSTNGGASWLSSSAGLLPTADIRALLLDPTNSSTVWAGAAGNGVYRSVDAGVTWVLIDAGFRLGLPESLAISDDGGTVYAASGGDGVYRLDLPVAPKVRSHPASTTVAAGGAVSLAARASGTPAPTVRWQVSTSGGSTWSDLTGATSATYSFTASLADSGKQFRAVFTNDLASATTNAATLSVAQALMTVSPSSLRFAATKNGADGAMTNVTNAQTVSVLFSSGAPAWTVSADQPWVQLSSAGGTGAESFTVSIVNPSNVLGASTAVSSTVTVTSTTASNSPRTIAVALTVDLTNGATVTAPIGQVDTPVQNATGVVGAIGVTGWVLDNLGVTGVKIYRNCLTWENQASCQVVLGHNVVEVGDAAFLAGARTDVEGAFTTYPANNRAGWGYLMLTSMLPQVSSQQPYGGQGPLTLYVVATDVEGNKKLLGRSSDPASADFAVPTQITMANDSIAKPFGAIDTPGQGQTVSGALNNFGWALTPDSNTTGGEGGDILIPTNGSTMTVFIDSLPVALVAYNQCRGNVGNPVPSGLFCNDDVANIFGNTTPQAVLTARTSNPTLFRNLDAGRAAIGVYTFDTATLANGLHTIAWSVTDSAGRTEGIGSRFFNVLNSGADELLSSSGAERRQ